MRKIYILLVVLIKIVITTTITASCSNKGIQNESINNLNLSDTVAFVLDNQNRIILKTPLVFFDSIKIPVMLDNECSQMMIPEATFNKYFNTNNYPIIDSTQKRKVYSIKTYASLNKTNINIDTILVPSKFPYSVLGAQLFYKNCVRVSFKDNLLIISQSIQDTIGYKKYQLHVEKTMKHLIYVIADLPLSSGETLKVRMGIDLGAPVNLITPNVGIDISKRIGKNKIDINKLNDKFLKKIALVINDKNYIEAIFDTDGEKAPKCEQDITLGMSCLKDFDIIFDYKNGNLYMK